MRFKYKSTRYKDIYDICFLLKDSNKEKIKRYLSLVIFDDENSSINSVEQIIYV